MFDRGIKVKEEVATTKETAIQKRNENHLDSAEVIWEKYLYYAIDLEKDTGGYGPDETISRARNLVFINIQTGSMKKLFKKNVFIHDFFPGTFTRKKEIRGAEEPKLESLDLGQRFVILAVEEDTNEDGFLNDKDLKKVFIYHPETETITRPLPGNYYFESLFFNSSQNILAMTVKKHIKPKKPDKNLAKKTATDSIEDKLFIFIYNVVTHKEKLLQPE